MSPKIPQTEWGAIVARREQGESLNAIARSYDCSAATIHSILNRARDGAAAASEPAEANEPAAAPEETAPPAPTPPPVAASELPNFLTRSTTRPAAPPVPRPPSAGNGASAHGATPNGPAPNGPVRPQGEPRSADQRPLDRQSFDRQSLDRQPRRVEIVPPRNGASVRRPEAGDHADEPAAPRPTNPLPHALATLPEALTATLDAGLRAHAETVVEAFRAAFDRALAENSPEARQALRLAAAELMRAGARTTIVLERLEAASHRPSFPRRDRPNGTAPQRPAG